MIQTVQFIIVEKRENIKEFEQEISGIVDSTHRGRYNAKKDKGGIL